MAPVSLGHHASWGHNKGCWYYQFSDILLQFNKVWAMFWHDLMLLNELKTWHYYFHTVFGEAFLFNCILQFFSMIYFEITIKVDMVNLSKSFCSYILILLNLIFKPVYLKKYMIFYLVRTSWLSSAMFQM